MDEMEYGMNVARFGFTRGRRTGALLGITRFAHAAQRGLGGAAGLAVLVAFLVVSLGAKGDDGITVNVKPSTVKERTFDRNHLPEEMPPMHKDEAAVTVSEFTADTRVNAEVVS